jgi:hypothetical protein
MPSNELDFMSSELQLTVLSTAIRRILEYAGLIDKPVS